MTDTKCQTKRDPEVRHWPYVYYTCGCIAYVGDIDAPHMPDKCGEYLAQELRDDE